jgi:hypothetical protein
MLAEGPKLGGSIDRFESGRRGQRHDAGDTDPRPERHAKGQIRPLLPPAKRGRKATAIELASPNLHVDAGQAVGFKTGLARAGQAMDLTLTGGTLADLLPGGRSWPRIDVVAQTRIDRHQLNIRGHVGPLAAIRTGRDLRLDLSLADDTDLTGTLTGTLARLHGLAGSQFQAQLTGKSLAALHPGLPAQAFSAKARIRHRPNSWICSTSRPAARAVISPERSISASASGCGSTPV